MDRIISAQQNGRGAKLSLRRGLSGLCLDSKLHCSNQIWAQTSYYLMIIYRKAMWLNWNSKWHHLKDAANLAGTRHNKKQKSTWYAISTFFLLNHGQKINTQLIFDEASCKEDKALSF